ncbi:MAG: PQQ-binding-like beta-propeller repeat protein [Planctomycetes bacterium]|nr:PQQ-binding-like beta-propeller repeat protein [Planctomycetota bacterium]
MADELEAIKQAAEQVIQNVADYRKKREALDDEVKVSKKDLVVPLLQRVKAKPDLYPQLVQRIVPQITLYVATDRGVVHAIDAETGQTRWAMPIGRPDHPNMEPAANERFVAVVNGSHLYVVNSQDGKFVWQRRLKSAPGAGPAIFQNLIFIPMVNGVIESFDLGRFARNFQDDEENLLGNYQEAKYFRSIGRSMVQPLATPNGTITWPTDRGHLYVMDGPQMQPRYRVISNRDIVARPTYLPPNKLFVASIDGYVHCVDEKTGSIIWSFSTGEPISQSPVPIGDSVFVITDDGNLFCIAATDRRERWFVPHIKQFLSASEKRVYVLADTGRMLVLDRKTGGRITSVDLGQIDLKFINMQSDRLFLGTSTGLIQCLHEPEYGLPLLHAEDEQRLQQRQDIATSGVPKPVPGGGGKPPVDAGGGAPDPFGVGDKPDPFGPKRPAGDGGTAPDPFGPKPSAGGAVPDPFGDFP